MKRREFIEKSAIIGGSSLLLSAIPKMNGIYIGDEDFDIIVRKGNVIDGTGKKRYSSDIGIVNGIIKEIGDLSRASAKTIISAENLIVSPGFIDIHTHTDLGILTNPRGESKIHQGVTTEIGGQCGGSFAPISNDEFIRNSELYKEKYGLELKFPSFGAHLEMMRKILGNDGTFNVVNGKYLNIAPPPTFSEEVLVEFKAIDSTSLHPYFINWIQRYSLAVCKLVLGQIRGKYQSLPSPAGGAQLNGDALIQQGTQEQEKLMEELLSEIEEPPTFTTF